MLAPPEAANSPILNNLVLTRILGLVHILFGGLLLFICITLTGSAALSPTRPDHHYLWAFLLLTPAAAMQFVGGYGFWRRKAWSWWLICLGAGSTLFILVPLLLQFVADLPATRSEIIRICAVIIGTQAILVIVHLLSVRLRFVSRIELPE